MNQMLQVDSAARMISQKGMISNSNISNPMTHSVRSPTSSYGALQARTSNLPMLDAAVLQRRESSHERGGSSKSVDATSIGTGAQKHQATTDNHVLDAYGEPIHNRAYEAHGVRFVPAEVIFYNAFRGQCYTTIISIVNISSHLLHLSISQPYSSAFHVKDDGTVTTLAPGLSISRKIIFKCAEGKLFDSVIPIRIHHSLVLLPIKVIPGQVHVVVEPTVLNFGRIDLGSAFVSRTVTLHNRGSISAKYAIDLSKNELDIMITRRTGSIKPFGTVEIKVQLSGLVVGEHETEFWVKSTPASRFIVRVTVVVPFLMAVHPFATEEFTLLDMAPCFPGTQRYETFLIRNSSSDSSAVIVLAESDGLVMPPGVAANDDISFRYFKLSPSDGTLAPFESRIFTLWFTPRVPSLEKGWKRPTIKERAAQYLCFFRVQRVTVTNIEDTEPIGAEDEARACQLDRIQLPEESYSSTNMTQRTIKSSISSVFDNEEKNNIIRVCAYSIAITPILNVVPDELIFRKVKIGQKINKVVRLYNPCELPLGFSFVKQAHLTVCPSTAQFLQPKKSIEVTVQFHPRSLQFEQKRLVFDLLSFQNLTDEKHLKAIGQVSVRLVITVEAEVPAATPQFLPGITPRTNLEGEEVGLHTELVLFSSKCPNIPKAVVWPKTTRDKPWLKSDARVAFPNELRRSLRVTGHDGNARSIFTGKPRYNVPDDPNNVYSPQELEFRRKEVAKYKDFVKGQAEAKINYFMQLDGENLKPEEYEVSDEKLYALLRSQPPVPPPELKPFMTHPSPHDVLCPLSPLQLFNIKVQPQVIDFGRMPPKTDCNTTIAVDNMNGFPISVRFKSYKESLKVHGGCFIVPSQSTSFQKITLHLDTTGKHYTNMSYIINTYHSYDMKVCAEVEVRSLILEPGELTFRGQSEKEIFEQNLLPVKLINPLGSPTFFKWKIPTGSPFGVVPASGSVPSRSSLRCSVFFKMKNGNVLGSVLVLQVDEGTHSHFPVNFIPGDKFTLTLFSPKISCPYIPLGVECVKKIIIFNHGRRLTFFSIDDRSLPKGVRARPYTGMIKARSCFTLTVYLHFTEIKKFSFKVPISSLMLKSVVFTCNGFVTYPLVTYNPRSMIFRKTPVHSHSCKEFRVQNECQGEVMLKFFMDEFSQFKISSTNDFADDAAALRDTTLTLAPLESRSLYLHFEPHDVAGYVFLLPAVINDILGPAVLSDSLSQRTSQYIPPPADDTNTANKIPGMTVPEKLESITVEVAVQRGFIKCNSFLFEFFKTDVKEKGGHSLSITNIHPRIPVTIRIQHPDPEVQPFSISGKHGYTRYEEPIVVEPNETIELNIMFVPPFAGTYATGVPIYVDEFSQDQPYAIIKLKGVFYRSSLTCTSSMVNFIPVEVDVEIHKVIEIIANHQPEDTKLSVMLVDSMGSPVDDMFTIVYPESNQIPYGIDNFVVYVKIKFRSEVPRSVIAFLTATDGYDGECKITVTAIADKSILTTHAFHFINSLSKIPRSLISGGGGRTGALTSRISEDAPESDEQFLTVAIVEEIEQYPLFPKSSSDSEYAKHMRRTKESMEDWLYEQGFQGKYRMTIGEDYYFSEPFQTAVNSTNKNARFEDVKSVIDLIIKLTGREFTAQYPLPPNCPVDKIGRIDFTVQAYKSVVSFLNRQGGHLIHVSPIYLLDYDDYILYHEKLKPAHLIDGPYSLQGVSQLEIVLEEDIYVRLSTQCWLDVFLQLYKVLIFYPTMMEPTKTSMVDALYSSSGHTDEKSRGVSAKASKMNASVLLADLENGEEHLLAWIDNIFAMDRPSCVPPRRIGNFTEDLRDGVVLGVITAHYCPFLSSYLADLFWTPKSKAEFEQNVGVLNLAWSAVKIGLSFTAQDLTSPHPVKMLMICCLLYSVLPTYFPRDTLAFEACLADNVNKQLKITNPSSHAIGFAIRKFDPNNCFSLVNVKNNVLKIAGNSSQVLDINFFAKHVYKVTATLVLCGTQVSGGYASNMVYIMKGMPAKLQHKLAFRITCPLYKVSKVKTSLSSPYAIEGEFSLRITEVEPKSSTANKLKPWSQVSQRKVIRSLYIPETTMTVPAVMEMPTTLTIIASALQLKNKDFWIIFSNPKIGDFLVKVTIIPDLTAPQHILHPPYPSRPCSEATKEGACGNPTCPRVVQIQIPSKNFRLWNAAKSMLSNTLNEKEKAFWDDYLETGLGLKLLGWIARQYHIGQNDMSFLFQQSVTYTVECNNPLVTCPPEITIDDVHSDDTVDLPVHLNVGAKAGLAVDIKLRAENELRYYQVVFYRKRSERSDKSQLSSGMSHSNSRSHTKSQSTLKKADSKPVCCDKNYFGGQP